MSITWLDVKNSLKGLLFERLGELNDYADNLPYAANYALTEVARFLCPLREKLILSHYPPENLLTDTKAIYTHTNEDINFSAENVAAVYFECDGVGTAVILDSDSNTLKTFELSSDKTFRAYRAYINYTGNITLRFSGAYRYNIRCVAMYDCTFSNSEESIPAYSPLCDYDMRKLVLNASGESLFMGFDEFDPVRVCKNQTTSTQASLTEIKNYVIEQNCILRLKREDVGAYEVLYKKYPEKITLQTQDTDLVDVTKDGFEAMLLLMAWRLYKEDDEQIACLYYNEYLRAKEDITKENKKSVYAPMNITLSDFDCDDYRGREEW